MSRRNLLVTFAPAALVGVVVLVALAVWAGLPARPPAVTPSPTPNPAIHAFPELEARLPTEIAGNVLEKVSLQSNPEAQSPKTLALLARLERQPADLQLARASLTGVDISVGAMRVIGANAIEMAVAFQAIDEADPESPSTYLPAQVAGKRVLIRRTGNTVEYVYPLDDILFVVSGNRGMVEEALIEIR